MTDQCNLEFETTLSALTRIHDNLDEGNELRVIFVERDGVAAIVVNEADFEVGTLDAGDQLETMWRCANGVRHYIAEVLRIGEPVKVRVFHRS